MKKRILLFVLVMSIVLSLVCVMVACGKTDVNDDSDNTSEGGNENESTASFDYQASVVNTQLETMRQGNGYLIKYNVGTLENTEATQITLGAKGDVYYVADGGHEYYYDVSNADHMDWYEKNGVSASWEKTTTAYSEYYTREQALDAMRAYIATYSSWMTYYQSFVSSMSEATKTSATVAGRSCDKFSFSAAALAGEGLNMVRASYSCYVDKSTSICLKWEYSATVDGTTESWTLECVEFNTNPTITLPSVSGGNIGGDDSTGSTSAPENNAGNVPDFSEIMAGNGGTDTVWGMQDPAVRQQIIDAAKADGFDVSFGADGSMTITDTDGTVIVQQPDGTWVMKDADGSYAQFGGEWPENEFTKLVPKPNFDVMGASSDDGSFTVAFSGVEIEQVKAYADKVKAKGFTIDATEESQNVYGVSIYSYTAYNSDGYCVEITFVNGTSGITISK